MIGLGDRDSLEEEQYTMQTISSKLVSMFEYYKYYSPTLQALCLFKYYMTIQILPRPIIPNQNTVDFAPDHPSYKKQVQQVIHQADRLFTVTFVGEFFRCEQKESQASSLNMDKPEIQNEIA